MSDSPFGSRTAFVFQAWRGELKLWEIFWLYGLLSAFAFATILFLADDLLGIPRAVLLLVYALYAIWITVSIWRCAFNCGWRGWAYLARASTLLGVVQVLVDVLSPAA